MRQRDVRVGAVYEVRVSGKLAPVKIIREYDTYAGSRMNGRQLRTRWIGKNLRTGREITIRSAAKLRRELIEREPARAEATRPVPPVAMPIVVPKTAAPIVTHAVAGVPMCAMAALCANEGVAKWLNDLLMS